MLGDTVRKGSPGKDERPGMNDARGLLDHFSVQLEPGVTIGHPTPGEMFVEPPVLIRKGLYDVEFLGAFSFIGGQNTLMRHVWMIGRFCSIAYNAIVGVEEHPTDFLSSSPLFQGAFDWGQLNDFRERNGATLRNAAQQWRAFRDERFGKIGIGSDVWIGEGALIRRGVQIGDGAIIASRSVVTRDVPPYAIVGGTPAALIRYRFEPAVIEALLQLQWWKYGLGALDGVDMADIHQAIDRIDRNIASGQAQPYQTPLVRLAADRSASLWLQDPENGALVEADPAQWMPGP